MTDLPREPLDGRAELVVEFGSLSMHSAREDDVHTISLIGELDVATAETVDHELERVEATDAETIVLDLAGLTFMDSTGVRLVMAAYARSRAETDRLALLRGPQQVQRVFELCGVDGLLPFAD